MNHQFSRRDFLKGVSVGAGAGLLSACTFPPSVSVATPAACPTQPICEIPPAPACPTPAAASGRLLGEIRPTFTIHKTNFNCVIQWHRRIFPVRRETDIPCNKKWKPNTVTCGQSSFSQQV